MSKGMSEKVAFWHQGKKNFQISNFYIGMGGLIHTFTLFVQ